MASRTEKVNFGKQHYKLYIDKNDAVFDVKECQVLSWKTIEKGRKRMSIPDEVVEKRDVELFDRVKGNPAKIAVRKVLAELEYKNL
jgi:hypothetical protein